MEQYTEQQVYDYLALGNAGDFVEFEFDMFPGKAKITRVTDHFCTMPDCKVEVNGHDLGVESRPSVLLPMIGWLMTL